MNPDHTYLIADSPMLAMAFPRWQSAMEACFHFELRVRLLAGRYSPAESVTEDVGHDKKGLLKLLFGRLQFSEVEQQRLAKINTVRNKLIHCEPDALSRLLKELDPAFQPPNAAHQIPLPAHASGEAILGALFHKTGAVRVQDTSTRAEGFAGWMMQAAGDGTFERAQVLLVEATKLIIEKGNAPSPQ